jgi:hypothetical protein
MIDFNNLPDESINQQVFFGNIDAANWQTWQKPQNCKYVYITAIGSGSGGGGGRRSSSNATSGGGGGASGAISSGFFQAAVLPDVLYVQVGSGGYGGTGNSVQASGSAGGAGEISYVAVGPNTGTAYIVLQSGTTPATGGPGGTLSAVSGGVGETAWGLTGAFTNLGQVITVPGQNGGAGNLSTINGGSITLNKIVSGGAGGGGTSSSTTTSSGGNITGAGIVPTISGIAGGVTGVGYNLGIANSGYQTRMPGKTYTARDPLIFTGGAGGGAAYVTIGSGTAGYGGNGSLGSGGGGGGGCNLSTGVFGRSGDGGRGGDGVVIITSF